MHKLFFMIDKEPTRFDRRDAAREVATVDDLHTIDTTHLLDGEDVYVESLDRCYRWCGAEESTVADGLMIVDPIPTDLRVAWRTNPLQLLDQMIKRGVHHTLAGMAIGAMVAQDLDAFHEVMRQCTKPTPRAVCLYVEDGAGNILAVSRKGDRTRFGLPGGKVEPGETLLQALVREVREETGLEVVKADPFFEKLCWGSTCYVSTTFKGIVRGQIYTEEPLDVRWVSMETLLMGPFADYNRRLFRKLGRMP